MASVIAAGTECLYRTRQGADVVNWDDQMALMQRRDVEAWAIGVQLVRRKSSAARRVSAASTTSGRTKELARTRTR